MNKAVNVFFKTSACLIPARWFHSQRAVCNLIFLYNLYSDGCLFAMLIAITELEIDDDSVLIIGKIAYLSSAWMVSK